MEKDIFQNIKAEIFDLMYILDGSRSLVPLILELCLQDSPFLINSVRSSLTMAVIMFYSKYDFVSCQYKYKTV